MPSALALSTMAGALIAWLMETLSLSTIGCGVPAGIDEALAAAQRVDLEGMPAGQRVLHGRRRAAIGHVQRLAAGALREQQAAHVDQAAVAGRAVGMLAGLLSQQRHQ